MCTRANTSSARFDFFSITLDARCSRHIASNLFITRRISIFNDVFQFTLFRLQFHLRDSVTLFYLLHRVTLYGISYQGPMPVNKYQQ